MGRLCERERLTTSQIQDYLEAWEHRLGDSWEEGLENPAEAEKNSSLGRYARVTSRESSYEIH